MPLLEAFEEDFFGGSSECAKGQVRIRDVGAHLTSPTVGGPEDWVWLPSRKFTRKEQGSLMLWPQSKGFAAASTLANTARICSGEECSKEQGRASVGSTLDLFNRECIAPQLRRSWMRAVTISRAWGGNSCRNRMFLAQVKGSSSERPPGWVEGADLWGSHTNTT